MFDYDDFYAEVYDGLTTEELAELEDQNYETVGTLLKEGFSVINLEWDLI